MTTFTWDDENLLTQIALPDNALNTFTYDADNKRVTAHDSDAYRRFLYDESDMLKLLQERDQNDDLIAHYTMGTGLEAMRRSDASSFYHFDALGSTFELTDSGEDVSDTWLYKAWGWPPPVSGTTYSLIDSLSSAMSGRRGVAEPGGHGWIASGAGGR